MSLLTAMLGVEPFSPSHKKFTTRVHTCLNEYTIYDKAKSIQKLQRHEEPKRGTKATKQKKMRLITSAIKKGCLTIVEIAEATGISRSTVTTYISALEMAGKVQRDDRTMPHIFTV